jgi:aspartate aminotransferase
MPASHKIEAFIAKSSWIRKMFEEGASRKAKFGADNVFDFSLGNPNLEPPPRFKAILRELVEDPNPCQHAYMPNAGYPETREAVAKYLNDNHGEGFTSNDIVMTVGAGGALNVVLKTILDPNEEVVIPSPYFVEYNYYLDNHQGVPVVVKTKEDFSLDFEAMEAAFTEKTRAVLINSPNNPTGKVYSLEEIETLGRLLRDKGRRFGKVVYLVSDEPYRKIVYDGVKVPSIFQAYEESFVVTSFSKDLSLPGERIGYAALNPRISDRGMIAAGLERGSGTPPLTPGSRIGG